MQVYKAFFKIIKKNISQLSIYLVLCIVFSIMFSNLSTSSNDTDFETTKTNIAFINNDENSKIISGFEEYLKNNTNIVNVGSTKEELQDALFFKEVEYIVIIPKGFTDEILKGNKNIDVERTIIPNSRSGIYLDNLINRYFNSIKIYASTLSNVSQSQIVSYVQKDLSHKSSVKIQTYKDVISNDFGCSIYYNFFAYSILAILILGVCSVMINFNKIDIKRRNIASAMSLKNFNFQIALGNITYSIGVWLIMIIISFIMYKDYMFTINGALFLLNSFVFTLSALSISLLASSFITNQNAMSAAANIITLGTCFISGVFVSQNFLGKTVLSIAKFNPVYWYIKANDSISTLVNYNSENIIPIFINILIVFAFAIAIYSVTLLITKKKRLDN